MIARLPSFSSKIRDSLYRDRAFLFQMLFLSPPVCFSLVKLLRRSPNLGNRADSFPSPRSYLAPAVLLFFSLTPLFRFERDFSDFLNRL